MNEDKQEPDERIEEALAMEIEKFKGNDGKDYPDFLDSFFPESESYGEKTRYRSGNTPMLISKGIRFAFEVEDLVEGEKGEYTRNEILKWIADYEKRLPSIHGKSREEYADILKAFVGGYRNQEKSKGKNSMLEKLFTTGESDESDMER